MRHCHSERSEESLNSFLAAEVKPEIFRFAQHDIRGNPSTLCNLLNSLTCAGHPRTVGRLTIRPPCVRLRFTTPTTTLTRASRSSSYWSSSRSSRFWSACFSRVQSSPKPSQEHAGKKRSHPNRERGERVLYGLWEVSLVTADTTYDPAEPQIKDFIYTLRAIHCGT